MNRYAVVGLLDGPDGSKEQSEQIGGLGRDAVPTAPPFRPIFNPTGTPQEATEQSG